MPESLDKHTCVAVIGAGSMGAGIAQLAAQAGHSVRLHDSQPGATARALEHIAADLDGAVGRGRMTTIERGATLKRIEAVDRVENLEGCGLAVEAIVERLKAKQSLFKKLESVLSPCAVLATNTSSISVTAVAQGLTHPQRVIGWHFFNPATRMKLVEVVCGVQTDPTVAAAIHALSAAWGKTSVDAPNAPGFLVNRIARPFYAEGLRLLAEKIAPAPTIDRLLREAGGFALGPFELMDLIGLEVNLSVTESVFQATANDPRYAPHLIQQELVRSGRFGRKTQLGFYDYRPEASPSRVDSVEPSGSLRVLRAAPDPGPLEPLLRRLQGAGVRVKTDDRLPAETLAIDDTRVALTDGRTATERGRMLLLDLARDFSTTAVLGVTASTNAGSRLADLAAVLKPAGIALTELADVAGLVVMRTVCCLANEAADVLTWTTASARDIDTAMRLGTAYPMGPLAWADALGPARVATVLTHLQSHYGEVRYRRAPQLSRRQYAQGQFHA